MHRYQLLLKPKKIETAVQLQAGLCACNVYVCTLALRSCLNFLARVAPKALGAIHEVSCTKHRTTWQAADAYG